MKQKRAQNLAISRTFLIIRAIHFDYANPRPVAVKPLGNTSHIKAVNHVIEVHSWIFVSLVEISGDLFVNGSERLSSY